jgi:hypothetical protein
VPLQDYAWLIAIEVVYAYDGLRYITDISLADLRNSEAEVLQAWSKEADVDCLLQVIAISKIYTSSLPV